MKDRKVNVLLVEDDEVDVMTVRRAFRKGNITNPLYVANNGLEALNVLRGKSEHLPTMPRERRLVLLDLNMPKMGGIEFLQVLRADPQLKETPVVVLTTSNGDRDRLEAYNLNVSGYILKPVQFEAFVETMLIFNKYWALCEML
jgi:CheY-like chemotaxis protein